MAQFFISAHKLLRDMAPHFDTLMAESRKHLDDDQQPQMEYNLVTPDDHGKEVASLSSGQKDALADFCGKAITTAGAHIALSAGNAPLLYFMQDKKKGTINACLDKDNLKNTGHGERIPASDIAREIERFEALAFSGWEWGYDVSKKRAVVTKRFSNEGDVKIATMILQDLMKGHGLEAKIYYRALPDGDQDKLSLVMSDTALRALADAEQTMLCSIEGMPPRNKTPNKFPLKSMNAHIRVFDEAKAIASRPPSYEEFTRAVKFSRFLETYMEGDPRRLEAFLQDHWQDFQQLRPQLLFIEALQRVMQDGNAEPGPEAYAAAAEKKADIRHKIDAIARDVIHDWQESDRTPTRFLSGDARQDQSLKKMLMLFAASVLESPEEAHDLMRGIYFDETTHTVTVSPMLFSRMQEEKAMHNSKSI